MAQRYETLRGGENLYPVIEGMGRHIERYLDGTKKNGRRGRKSDITYHSTRIRLIHRKQRQGTESLRNKLN
tara:strand:- start:2073 stop:2285 length:213 start_codon:yes stop_codon:yes gene_type:complete